MGGFGNMAMLVFARHIGKFCIIVTFLSTPPFWWVASRTEAIVLPSWTMAHQRAMTESFQQDLRQAAATWTTQKETTAGAVYSAGQDLWFSSRKKRMAPAMSPQTSQMATPVMDVDGTAASGSSETTPHLFSPVPIEEDTAYAATANAQGINMNNPQEVQRWMGETVNTRAEVFRTIRAYHTSVIRPEVYNLVAQVEQAITKVTDQVLRLQDNLAWMQSENRQAQKVQSGLQALVTGFPADMSGDDRLFMVNWMLGQTTAVRTFLQHRGWTEVDEEHSHYWWLNALQSDPSTPPTSEGKFSSVTILNFKSWDLRKAFLADFGGASGTPLWKDNRTAVPQRHVRVSPATPQYQRKLEIPIRVLLEAINHAPNLPSNQVVILWRTLTVMSPQADRTFNERATACARLHYFEEAGIFKGHLEVDEQIYEALETTPPADWKVEEPTLWAWAWNTVVFGVQHEIDMAEKKLFAEKAKVSKGDGKGLGLGKGRRHYSAPLIYSSEMNPYPIPLTVSKVPSVAFVWDELCDKLSVPEQKVGDYGIATYVGRPGGPKDTSDHSAQVSWGSKQFSKAAPPKPTS